MSSRRHADAINDVAYHCLGSAEFSGLEERFTDDPVSQHRHGQSFDIVWHDVLAPTNEGQTLGRAVEGQGSSRTHADIEFVTSTRGVNLTSHTVASTAAACATGHPGASI